MALGNSFNPKWLEKLVSGIFIYRYAICLLFAITIIGLWFILYFARNWTAKDAAQVCTGFFIVISLFFAVLNYEFATSRAKRDNQSAREVLTFNTANEWHKPPVKDYQRISIEYENRFIYIEENRSVENFYDYIESNLDFRESLKGILNYFENMSVGVNRGLIDNSFIFEFHCYIVETYYRDYYHYIEYHRIIKGNPIIWRNFTNLAEEWFPSIKTEIISGTKNSTIIN